MSAAGPARRELRRAIRLVRLLWHLAGGAIAAHTLLPLLQLRRDPRAADALVGAWMRRLLDLLGVRVEISGERAAYASLLVANHVSWLDIPVVRSHATAAFVAKDEVRRWPLVGAMAARAGTLFLARGNGDASATIAELMTWMLAANRAVLVFPEGTTTGGEEVRNFHSRLYQPAIHTGAWVQAVAITYPGENGTHPAAPFVGEATLAGHLWRLLAAERVCARVHYCEPVCGAGTLRRVLARVTREQIAAALGLAADAPVSAPPGPGQQGRESSRETTVDPASRRFRGQTLAP